MRRPFLLWISLLCLLLLPCVVHADLINGGFETGDLTGWTFGNTGAGYPDNYATVVSGWSGETLTYSPPEGSYFLALHGWNYDWVYQDVSLNAGQSLSGWAALDNASDTFGFTGSMAWAQILDVNTDTQLALPWSAGPPQVPDHTSGAWTPWTWTAPYSGTFQLGYYVNAGNADSYEYGLFDTHVNAPVPTPEPGTCGLLLMGLPAVGLLLRRRRSGR